MSNSRLVGCQSASNAIRNSVYRPTPSTRDAGIFGMFSVTRLSAGVRSPVWAVNRLMDSNRPNRISATFFIFGHLTEDVDMIEKPASSSVDRSWLTGAFYASCPAHDSGTASPTTDG